MLKKNQNMVFGLHPSIQTFGRISYGSVQSTKGPRLELFFDVWKVSKRANHKAIQIGSWEEHGGILMYTLNYIHYIEHYRTHMGTVWVQYGYSLGIRSSCILILLWTLDQTTVRISTWYLYHLVPYIDGCKGQASGPGWHVNAQSSNMKWPT